MFDSIFATTSEETTITLVNLITVLGVAVALGLLISLVYMKTRKSSVPSQSFLLTLVMLPAVVAVIILLVGNSVAKAFSLAGAFTIIRFRSAPGDAKDITYVLFASAVGLAAGMGYLIRGRCGGRAVLGNDGAGVDEIREADRQRQNSEDHGARKPGL